MNNRFDSYAQETIYYRLQTESNIDVDEWDSNLTIFKYIQLRYFIDMLVQQKLFVGQKSSFSDYFETNLSPKLVPCFYYANKQAPKERVEIDSNEYDNLNKTFKSFAAIPASCWTWQERENYMMWSVYASQYGVRIKTKLCKLLSSLNCRDFQIVCDKMRYKHHFPHNSSIEEMLFYKTDYYSDEREFRIYFNPISPQLRQELNKKQHLNIHIRNPVNMIEEVVFSPFITHTPILKNLLVTKFGFDIKTLKNSQIKIQTL